MTDRELVIPDIYFENARKFMYFQQFKASLPFDEFLEDHTNPGFVRLKKFSWWELKAEHSPTMASIINGMVNEQPFQLEESENA